MLDSHKPNRTNVNETVQGRDKVSLYGWVVKDTPGEFKEIEKSKLRIPEEYQRDHHSNDPKILGIAKEWSWVAFVALPVSRREDGFYYVIDGGHRLMAALKRNDIKTLPCMVFQLDGVSEEAKGFLRVNKNRKPMFAIESYKAQLEAGDEAALLLEELCRPVGRKVAEGGGPHTVSCPGTILSCIKEDSDCATRAFRATAAICEGHALNSDIMKGLMVIERKLEGRSVTDRDVMQRLKSIGPDDLVKSIASTKGYLGKGGPRICAMGIQNAYNKGLRTNKLEVIQ